MWNHNGYCGYYKNRNKGKHLNTLQKYHILESAKTTYV
jgi:hypothetical protein